MSTQEKNQRNSALDAIAGKRGKIGVLILIITSIRLFMLLVTSLALWIVIAYLTNGEEGFALSCGIALSLYGIIYIISNAFHSGKREL